MAASTSINGAARKAAAQQTKSAKKDISQRLADVDGEIERAAAALSKLQGDIPYYLVLQCAMPRASIDASLVDDVYEGLRKKFPQGNERLMVILSSYGGDIDDAYNLAMQFRRYAKDRLVFVVPRMAKSAATLLVCAGDEILLTPAAELGPLDPQITEFNPLERRLEHFSPLHIQGTLELIDDLFKQKKTQLADALVQRLQFPLTLGSHRQTLKISKSYVTRLLESRMLKDDPDKQKSGQIADSLAEGYAGHGACILCEETSALGLNASLLTGEAEDVAWSIHRLERRKRELLKEKRKQENLEALEELPPELLEILQGEIASAASTNADEEGP